MPPGYLLDQNHIRELQAVVRERKSTPKGRRPMRRRRPVFQPTAAGYVYQCVLGMRLARVDSPTDSADIRSTEPAVLCIRLGDASAESITPFGRAAISDIRSAVLNSPVLDSKGVIVPDNVSLLSDNEKIKSIIEDHIGDGEVTMLSARYADGYFGTGSIVVGNNDFILYGVGSQVFRAVEDDGDTGVDDTFFAELSPQGFSSDRIIMWDRGGNFASGTGADAYVVFPKDSPFEAESEDAETSTTWSATSGGKWLQTEEGALPVFELITVPAAGATVIGVPAAFTQAGNFATLTIYEGTPGSETSTGDTISAYVRRGVVFAGKLYRAAGVNSNYEVLNPSPIVRGQPTGDVAAGASGTLNVYTGAFGSETQPSGSPTVSNVRNDGSCSVLQSLIATAEWVDDNGGWQFIVGKTS
jgi:hypothetical protein